MTLTVRQFIISSVAVALASAGQTYVLAMVALA